MPRQQNRQVRETRQGRGETRSLKICAQPFYLMVQEAVEHRKGLQCGHAQAKLPSLDRGVCLGGLQCCGPKLGGEEGWHSSGFSRDG